MFDDNVSLIDESRPEPKQALTPAVDAMTVFERLAKDPSVDVEKLERVIAMHERLVALQAKAAFDRAFAEMKPHLPQVDERGRIEVRGQLRSTYARLEDIDTVITPIISRHGFAVRHKTQWPADKPGIIRIVGILTHAEGHREETEFEAKADASDFRSDVQSQGSTISYGRRYTTLELLNIVTRGVDNDGQKKDERPAPAAPAGYDDCLTDLSAAADEGWPKLSATFSKIKPEYRKHLTTADKDKWAAMRSKAEKVQK